MSDTPIAFRTRRRNQLNLADPFGPFLPNTPTPTLPHSSSLTIPDNSSLLLRLNQELPPIPMTGIGLVAPNLVLQLEEQASLHPDTPESIRNESEYRRRYIEVMGESPTGIGEVDMERIRNRYNPSVLARSTTPRFSQPQLTHSGPHAPTPGPSGIPHSSGPISSMVFAPRPFSLGLPAPIHPYPSYHPQEYSGGDLRQHILRATSQPLATIMGHAATNSAFAPVPRPASGHDLATSFALPEHYGRPPTPRHVSDMLGDRPYNTRPLPQPQIPLGAWPYHLTAHSEPTVPPPATVM